MIFEIFIENCVLMIKINNVFDLFIGIVSNSWNLVCINFSTRVSVFINGIISEGMEKKSLRIGKFSKFEKFCVGNNCAFSVENNSFIGMISSLSILQKSF